MPIVIHTMNYVFHHRPGGLFVPMIDIHLPDGVIPASLRGA
jgi:hypothetical protein